MGPIAEPPVLTWLDARRRRPLYRQLYRALRAAILDGRAGAGRAPAVDARARADARLARNTVLRAYEQLVAEGYVDRPPRLGDVRRGRAARRRRGERRRAARAAPAAGAALRRRLSRLRRRARAGTSRAASAGPARDAALPLRLPLRAPGRSATSRTRRGRACSRGARARPARATSTTATPAGLPALRAAIAGYLARARGVDCEPEQVLVVHGTQQALDLAARVLLDPGDARARRGAALLGRAPRPRRSAGARLVPLPVDARRVRRRRRGRAPSARAPRVRDAVAPVPDRRRHAARAPPRAARVGGARGRVRARGRLRRRVPLRRAPARVAPGASTAAAASSTWARSRR